MTMIVTYNEQQLSFTYSDNIPGGFINVNMTPNVIIKIKV